MYLELGGTISLTVPLDSGEPIEIDREYRQLVSDALVALVHCSTGDNHKLNDWFRIANKIYGISYMCLDLNGKRFDAVYKGTTIDASRLAGLPVLAIGVVQRGEYTVKLAATDAEYALLVNDGDDYIISVDKIDMPDNIDSILFDIEEAVLRSMHPGKKISFTTCDAPGGVDDVTPFASIRVGGLYRYVTGQSAALSFAVNINYAVEEWFIRIASALGQRYANSITQETAPKHSLLKKPTTFVTHYFTVPADFDKRKLEGITIKSATKSKVKEFGIVDGKTCFFS